MPPDYFYQQIAKISALSPYDRYARLGKFHTEWVIRYLDIIRTMNARDAAQIGSDGRTLGQIVGHIAEWERFTILAAGEMICGSRWPQIMSLSGYLDADGQRHTFTSVDEFNAHQANKHTGCAWESIRDLALHTATSLHTLFTQPALLSPDTLQKTEKHQWRLPTGLKLTLPVGWYLWMVSIEHECVIHAQDLGWPLS